MSGCYNSHLYVSMKEDIVTSRKKWVLIIVGYIDLFSESLMTLVVLEGCHDLPELEDLKMVMEYVVKHFSAVKMLLTTRDDDIKRRLS